MNQNDQPMPEKQATEILAASSSDGEPLLTAILITKNEAKNIAECLSGLRFCDEIVVIDNNSEDGTAEIARSMGCQVIQTDDWPGFGCQKQRALDNAHGIWVLSIDADERVTSELQTEIQTAISNGAASGYLIKRKSEFLGQWMRHGGWTPDYVLRLARRELCRFDPSPVHEKLLVEGVIAKLRHHFLHYSYRTIDDVLSKQRRYALISAEKIRNQKGDKASVVGATLRSLWTFLRLYCLRLGVLDGRRGFISAVFKAQEVFWKYLAAEFDATNANGPR